MAAPTIAGSHSASPAPPVNYLPALWVGGLILLSFLPAVLSLTHQWQANEDMGHGLFVPLFSAYVIWERRTQLAAAVAETDTPGAVDRGRKYGLLLMACACLQFLVANLAAELFVQRLAILLSIVGAVLYLGGSRVLRVAAFPLALLLFAIPIPGIALKAVTFPLQLLSSDLAERTLEMLGYTVVRDGNVLELAGQQLSVVEACSGLRAILSLSFFSVCYGYLFDSRAAVRWLLVAATIPVALIANASRIVFTGILAEIDKKLATGFFHVASGWVIFVVSIALLMIVHKILARFFSGSGDPLAVTEQHT